MIFQIYFVTKLNTYFLATHPTQMLTFFQIWNFSLLKMSRNVSSFAEQRSNVSVPLLISDIKSIGVWAWSGSSELDTPLILKQHIKTVAIQSLVNCLISNWQIIIQLSSIYHDLG